MAKYKNFDIDWNDEEMKKAYEDFCKSNEIPTQDGNFYRGYCVAKRKYERKLKKIREKLDKPDIENLFSQFGRY